MANLEIKNGNLFDNGIKIIPEFGNLEQIKIIREYEEKMKDFLRGLPVDPSFEHEVTARLGFNCICGKFLQVSAKSDKEECIGHLDGTGLTCKQCEKEYSVDVIGNEVVVTFCSKKKK